MRLVVWYLQLFFFSYFCFFLLEFLIDARVVFYFFLLFNLLDFFGTFQTTCQCDFYFYFSDKLCFIHVVIDVPTISTSSYLVRVVVDR